MLSKWNSEYLVLEDIGTINEMGALNETRAGTSTGASDEALCRTAEEL
jgi:hypothetical protein